MGLNTFDVAAIPTTTVYQFEVLIGSGVEKRGCIMAVWSSKQIRDAIGSQWIFDGNRLAWALKPISREIRLTIDLDKEKGKTPRPGKEDQHRVVIRQTNTVRFDCLDAFLSKKASFDDRCLEAINCLDQILREFPSRNLTKIKRSFFPSGPQQQRFQLGAGVEALKGVYQSIRMSNSLQGAGRISVNVDVANGTFFTAMPLTHLALQLTNRHDINDLVHALKQGDRSRAAQDMKKLRRVHVVTGHRNGVHDEYMIDKLIFQSAKECKFTALDSSTGKEFTTSVYDFFLKKYNVRLSNAELPLVKMTRGKNTILPMEVLQVKPNQRYMFKLDEKQTSNMIKFAVTPPNERWAAIQQGLGMLDWHNDPVLKVFGLRINPDKTIVSARLLTAPKVQFGQGVATPGTSGRWDLKGKKFLQPNPAPLKSWSVTVIAGRRGGKPDRAVVENFIKSFINTYASHGGRVEQKQPAMVLATGDDPGAWVTSAWNAAGQQANVRPQILVFILPDKDALTYGRIKRSADCRYGVVSQCMQYAHVQKAQPQYMSNVCMKFNAKLGGTTARAVGPKSGGSNGLFAHPTVIVGADVSHAAPGSAQPSMAALTMSMDALSARYAAAVDTNGYRVEMISKDNIDNHLKTMLHHWVTNVGSGKLPSRIIYLRDGVSEGQYKHVIDQEVRNMKDMLKQAVPRAEVPFVVIVGSKRHHVRFFPEKGKGDRNNNPLPGTLVEAGVTHPFENDFYLCSHSAIKGTARPTHYQVLLNEAAMSNDEIHTMLYEQSYQYMRSTTPVSIHPAIYYAHIASNRAISHDPKYGSHPDSSSGTKPSSETSGAQPGDAAKLLPMPNQGAINSTMWYI